MKFYNRENEIESLSKIEKNFRIAIIGRRRIGKTTLAEHFYKSKAITFFVSAEKSEKEIITSWVNEYPDTHLPNVTNLLEFFDFVFFHLKDRVIFIDEMQNLLKVNKSFIFDLQRLIDKYKPNLVVSGSLISMMKKIIESYKSPLYGRFDLIIKLKELDFKTVCNICHDLGLNIEEAFSLYAVFGGIPKYYELIEKTSSFKFKEFVLSSFVKYPRPLYEEVRTMLKEEFGKEYKTFFSILSSISQGKNRHSEIAGYLNKKETEITKYLALLKDDFEIIERKVPLVGGKKGIYSIKNNIVSFWFNNIWRYNQFLELGQEEKLIELMNTLLNKHISRTFEKTIIELLRSKIINLINPSSIGNQWGKFKGEKGKDSYEIDILAINENTKEIMFCECKWQDDINSETILRELTEKARYVAWHNEERKESYALFAKSFKSKINEFEGKKVYCFGLRDIEKVIITLGT